MFHLIFCRTHVNLLNNLVSTRTASKSESEKLEMLNNRLIEQWIVNDTINYIKWVVEPQITNIIEANYLEREIIEQQDPNPEHW